MKERLEDVLRRDEAADELVLLRRGGVYDEHIRRLQQQASQLNRRFTYRGGPCFGVSVFAATPDTEADVLATNMNDLGPRLHLLRGRLGRVAGESVLQPDTWKEAPVTTADHAVDLGGYQEGLEVDLANEDQPGFIWTWLDAARDQTQIVPGAVLTLRDREDLAMAQVVDFVPADDGTIVHLRLLPGAVEDYQAAIERAKRRTA